MNYLYCVLIGYALGCLSPSYFLGKLKGIDIRSKGSNNAGASNVTVTLGWGYGILTGLIDILKSFFAVLICKKLFGDLNYGVIGGASAVLGHIFPFYLQFKGGKGFASYLGMMLALNWKYTIFLFIVTIVITLVTDYIVMATFTTITLSPLFYLFYIKNTFIFVVLLVLFVIILYKHRINITRLKNGEEIGLRKKNKKKNA